MGCYISGIRAGRYVRPVLSNVAYSCVRDKCVKHCRYLLLSSCLFAGVGLNLSGGEAVLLGYVSVVSCWCEFLMFMKVIVKDNYHKMGVRKLLCSALLMDCEVVV